MVSFYQTGFSSELYSHSLGSPSPGVIHPFTLHEMQSKIMGPSGVRKDDGKLYLKKQIYTSSIVFKGPVNLQKTFFKLLLIEKPVMREIECRKPHKKNQNSYKVMAVSKFN